MSATKALRVCYHDRLRSAATLPEKDLRVLLCDFIDRMEMLDSASTALAEELNAWRDGQPPVQTSYAHLWDEDRQDSASANPALYQCVLGGPCARPVRLGEMSQEQLLAEMRLDESRLQPMQELARCILTATDALAKIYGETSTVARIVAACTAEDSALAEEERAVADAGLVTGVVTAVDGEFVYVEATQGKSSDAEYRFALEKLHGRKRRLKVGATVLLELDAMGLVDKAALAQAESMR